MTLQLFNHLRLLVFSFSNSLATECDWRSDEILGAGIVSAEEAGLAFDA